MNFLLSSSGEGARERVLDVSRELVRIIPGDSTTGSVPDGFTRIVSIFQSTD